MTRSILVKDSGKKHSTPRSTRKYTINTPSIIVGESSLRNFIGIKSGRIQPKETQQIY